MTLRSIIPLFVAAFISGLLSGWIVRGWQADGDLERLRREHVEQLRRTAEANARAVLEQQAGRLALEGDLAAIDYRHYQELTNAQAESDRLAADLAAASRRLSVRATCPAMPAPSDAAGMDDAAGARAVIHPADAAAIVRVTARADECRARLTALQAWALRISSK